MKKKSITNSLPSPPRDQLPSKNQNLPDDSPIFNLPEIPHDLPSLDTGPPSPAAGKNTATGKNTPKENGRGRSTSGSSGGSTASGGGGGGGGGGGSSGGGGKYTQEEIAVLR